MIGSAAHHGLNVSDMDAALSFYRDTLGLTELRRFPMGAAQTEIVGVADVTGEIAFLDAGTVDIELIAYDTPKNENVHTQASSIDVGVAHLCLTVEDIEAEYDRLSSEAPFINPPQRVGNGAEIAYLRDPDGNVVELLEPPVSDA